MKRVVLGVAALIVSAMFCAPLFAQDQVAKGKTVFEKEKCSMCHTATKNSLEEVGSKLTADQIREWISNPKAAAEKYKSTAKPPMLQRYEKLDKADVDALVAYLETKKKK